MRSRDSLRNWICRLLPSQSPCSQGAAADLLRSLFVSFTTNLTQLARQADRSTPTRGARQFFHRWLARPHWEPTALYAALPDLLQRPWKRRRLLPLLLDFTHVDCGGEGWSVLQVSLPWERRALPVYRAVLRRSQPETAQRELVLQVCDWLVLTVPGSRRLYVLIMDRGFPSHALLNDLRARGWRFVVRVHGDWTMRHAGFEGRLRDAHQAGQVGVQPRWFGDAQLGWRTSGRWAHERSCERMSCGIAAWVSASPGSC